MGGILLGRSTTPQKKIVDTIRSVNDQTHKFEPCSKDHRPCLVEIFGTTNETWFGPPPEALVFVDQEGQTKFVNGFRGLCPDDLSGAAFGRHGTDTMNFYKLPNLGSPHLKWDARNGELVVTLDRYVIRQDGVFVPGRADGCITFFTHPSIKEDLLAAVGWNEEFDDDFWRDEVYHLEWVLRKNQIA